MPHLVDTVLKRLNLRARPGFGAPRLHGLLTVAPQPLPAALILPPKQHCSSSFRSSRFSRINRGSNNGGQRRQMVLCKRRARILSAWSRWPW